jgi:hypothetical protein
VPEGDDLAAFRRLNEVGRAFCLAGLVENPGDHPLDGFISDNSGESPPYLNCIEDKH